MIIEGSFERILDSDPSPSRASEAERAPRGDQEQKSPLLSRTRMSVHDVFGSLGQTLSGPGSHGRTTPSIPAAELVPPGDRFIAGSYSNGAGTRAFKLYLSSGYDGRALPLIVMLHGCTQSPDDFAAGTRMNLLAESRPALSFIRSSLRLRTPRSAGTGSTPTISNAVKGSPRSSPASPARS